MKSVINIEKKKKKSHHSIIRLFYFLLILFIITPRLALKAIKLNVFFPRCKFKFLIDCYRLSDGEICVLRKLVPNNNNDDDDDIEINYAKFSTLSERMGIVLYNKL